MANAATIIRKQHIFHTARDEGYCSLQSSPEDAHDPNTITTTTTTAALKIVTQEDAATTASSVTASKDTTNIKRRNSKSLPRDFIKKRINAALEKAGRNPIDDTDRLSLICRFINEKV